MHLVTNQLIYVKLPFLQDKGLSFQDDQPAALTAPACEGPPIYGALGCELWTLRENGEMPTFHMTIYPTISWDIYVYIYIFMYI